MIMNARYPRVLPMFLATLIMALCQVVPVSPGIAEEPRAEKLHFLELDVHTYAAAASHFEDAWSFYQSKGILANDRKEGIVLEREGLLGYVAPGHGHKAIVIRWDKNHALILIHFENKQRDDVAIGAIARTELTSKFLVALIESIPDVVDSSLHREGYPLTADREFDREVFERDFHKFLDETSTAIFKINRSEWPAK
jgi:hypothetical protein